MNIKNMKITDIIPYDKPPPNQRGSIADSKTGEIAEWDYSLLPVELKELQAADFDLSLTIPLTFRCGGIGKTVSPFLFTRKGRVAAK